MDAFESISEYLQGQPSSPPIQQWHPALSGDIDIVIRRDGRWFHEGGEIKRQALVNLFASILRREDDGCYYLVTPVEKWRVRVEELPLLIVSMELLDAGTAAQQVLFASNVGSRFLLSGQFPLGVEQGSEGPVPFLQLSNGLKARLERAVYYRLADLLEEREGCYQLLSDGQWFSLVGMEE